MGGRRQFITGVAAAGLLLAVVTAAQAVELPYSGTDLRLWLHADGNMDLTGGTYPTRIDTWYDHTGVGGNTVAEDGTGKPGNKPDFVASEAAFNGRPVVRFDATAREVDGASPLPAGSGARTIIIVASSTGTANDILFDPNGQGGGAGNRLFRITPEVRTRYGNGNTTPGADPEPDPPDFSVTHTYLDGQLLGTLNPATNATGDTALGEPDILRAAGIQAPLGLGLSRVNSSNNGDWDGRIELLDGFDPAGGSIFDLITAQDIILTTGFGLDQTAFATSSKHFHLAIVRGGRGEILRLQAVPEPATLAIWALLAAAGVLVGWRRRKG